MVYAIASDQEIIIKNRWIKSIIVIILGTFSFEVFMFLKDSITTHKRSIYGGPLTFHWVWELISLLIVWFLIKKKLKVQAGHFFGPLIIGMLLSVPIWLILPDSFKVENTLSRYQGVVARFSLSTHEEGRYDERTEPDYPLECGFLYKINDPAIWEELNELKEDNEYVDTESFIFWQTGLAFGCNPAYISQYGVHNSLFDHIKLFVMVGPTVLLECLIKGFYRFFIIMYIFQIVWFYFKRDLFWWNDTKI